MFFQTESFTLPNQVVHCLLITCTHTHIRSSTIRNLYQDAIEQSNVQIWPSNAAFHARSSNSSFPTSPTWDGIQIKFTSIRFWHRLHHNCLHSYTSGWVKRNFPRQHSLDRTQAIRANSKSLQRLYNLSNMSECSEQSTQLSSENTSRTWDPPTPISWTAKPAQPSIKKPSV
jgi:hypothetical protein